MAIFVFKILALVIRTVAKPLITWATYHHRMKLLEQNYKNGFIKEKIMWIGQITNYYNTKFNRKVFRLPTGDPIKKLTDEKAIEKGAEFLSELLIYSILLAIPIAEWWRQSKINQLKEEIKKNGVRRMRHDIELISKDNNKLKNELKELKAILVNLNNKI